MLVVFVVAAIACILAAGLVSSVLRVWRRRQRDELRSIGTYHERLDSLHVGATDRGGSVRLVDDAAAAAASVRAAPGRPRVSPGLAPFGRAPAPIAPEQPGRQGRRWALGRSEPRHRMDTQALLIAIATALAVGALALVGVLLEHRHEPSGPPIRHGAAAVAVAAPGYAVAAPRWSSTKV